MKRLILPVIAALLIGAPAAAIAAPHNHQAQVNKEHRVVRREHRAVHRANHATHRAKRATVRAHRATVHAHRASADAHRDLQHYRAAVRAQHRYHWATWHQPSGWYYRRWAVGGYLPRGWFSSDFWIPNYVSFGLLAPPPDYQWVREGADAVLVNINTGEVLRVEYDVFY